MRQLQLASLSAALLWGLLSAPAAAQSTAHNTVTVSIPTVLRLKIDAAGGADRASAGFTIQDSTVTPDHLTIEVFANDAWSLTVDEVTGSGPHLRYDVDRSGRWRSTATRSTVGSSPVGTNGWASYYLRFRVDGRASGRYQRTLLFTLSHP